MTSVRLVIAAALAGAVILTGCAAAAATSAPSGTTKASGDTPRLTEITAYSINTDSPLLTSVVSGAIGDYGPAEEVSSGSAAVAGHGGELDLKLTRGSFGLNIAALDAQFGRGSSHEPVFAGTCSTYVSVSGAVPVVVGSGTGAYRGIAGTFAMTLTLNEVHGRPCTTSLSILRQVIVLSGAGQITMG